MTRQQYEDYEWYLSHFDELFCAYGHCWVIICKKRVLGQYHTQRDAVCYARQIVLDGEFIVQECAQTIEETYINMFTPLLIV